MLKTACFFTGDNYQLVAADTPASKKKIIAMALAMMVPVLIWVFNGFMLSFQVLNAGWAWALLTGLVCGTIVFFIEKLIVMANGNGWLTFFRVAIGLIVAILGSIAIDEVIFRNDIDISMVAIKANTIAEAKDQAAWDFMKLNDYDKLNTGIKEAEDKYEKADQMVIDEANGSYGTGKRGAGKITQLKDRKAGQRKAELDKLNGQLAALNILRDKEATAAAEKAEASFNDHALLTRIKALFRLISSDRFMKGIYILFTLLLFFFEFLVVILKLTWKKTNYELKLEMVEQLGRNRMEFLQRKESPLNDPGNYLPKLQLARNALSKNSSLFK